MKIEIFPPLSIHEIGKRDNQEDALWPEEATTQSRLFILCDGMGGYEHGETASQTVCQTIPHVLRRSMSMDSDSLSDEDLLNCLEHAYQELDCLAGESMQRMGTTIALLYVGRNGATAMHMGDSRIYHIRPNVGILYQSRDHSLATELFQVGEITYEEMLNYPKKNIVTRAMMPGEENRMRPDIIHITDIQTGDYFYLCSDGMLEQKRNRQIMSIFSLRNTDEEKYRLLVDETKDNQDNHSAWIIHIKSVIIEEGDHMKVNEELTSRNNMVHGRPPAGYEESDVVIVDNRKSLFSKITNLFKK